MSQILLQNALSLVVCKSYFGLFWGVKLGHFILLKDLVLKKVNVDAEFKISG